MKVLITGAAGFIGSHLAQRLVAEHEVVIVDELNDYYDPRLKQENLRLIGEHGRFAFHQIDISNEQAMFEVVAAASPEVVVHLAARAGVRPSLADPLLYERVNVKGTLVILEAARRVGVQRVVFGSSSSVYGSSHVVPFDEVTSSTLPISPYAATKLAGEALCHTYSHLYGLQATCLRFFTVYGPRQRPDLAIRSFTENILRGRPITLFGDGQSSRDYTFVEDIVAGIVAAMHYDHPYSILNLGNSTPVSLLELVHTIEGAVGKKALIEWQPDQPGDVPTTFANISRASAALGYQPKVPFAVGIQRFVDWYCASNAVPAELRA